MEKSEVEYAYLHVVWEFLGWWIWLWPMSPCKSRVIEWLVESPLRIILWNVAIKWFTHVEKELAIQNEVSNGVESWPKHIKLSPSTIRPLGSRRGPKSVGPAPNWGWGKGGSLIHNHIHTPTLQPWPRFFSFSIKFCFLAFFLHTQPLPLEVTALHPPSEAPLPLSAEQGHTPILPPLSLLVDFKREEWVKALIHY